MKNYSFIGLFTLIVFVTGVFVGYMVLSDKADTYTPPQNTQYYIQDNSTRVIFCPTSYKYMKNATREVKVVGDVYSMNKYKGQYTDNSYEVFVNDVYVIGKCVIAEVNGGKFVSIKSDISKGWYGLSIDKQVKMLSAFIE